MGINDFVLALDFWGFIVAIVFFVTTLIIGKANPKQNIRLATLMLIVALLLATDGLYALHNGMDMLPAVIVCRLSMALEYLLGYCIICKFISFIYVTLEDNGATGIKPFLLCSHFFQIVAAVLLIISQWTGIFYYFDENNKYVSGKLFWLSPACGIVSIAICMAMVISKYIYIRKSTFASVIIYVVIAILGGVLESVFVDIPFINIGFTIDAILVFVEIQKNASALMRDQQKRLYVAQMESVMSQVDPGYLIDCMEQIKARCTEENSEIGQLIEGLTVFIHSNLEAISSQKCVPFKNEIEFVRSYVNLENARLGTMIHVEYDIKEEDFALPALILQPFVDNAIRHGLLPQEGGTIIISTCVEDGNSIIRIADNGEGFSQKEELSNREKIGIGIENARERLAIMCKGEVEVDSEPGKGTTVTITIPKDGV